MKVKNILSEQQAEAIAEFLHIVSNANRLKMVCVLMHREMCRDELARTVGLSQAAVFHHLIVLNAAHLIRTRKVSATTYYKLCPEAIPCILAVQKLLEQAEAMNLLLLR